MIYRQNFKDMVSQNDEKNYMKITVIRILSQFV